MSPKGDEKSGWRKANDLPAPTADEVRRMLSPWLDGQLVREVELLPGGLMNRNCRVRLDNPPSLVVLRLYDRDGDACAKEVAILQLLHGQVPVPGVLYSDPIPRDDGPPFALLEFIDGVSLRSVKLSGDQAAIGEAAYDAGRVLARLQAYPFPRVGPLSPSLSVDASFMDGPVTTAGLVELFAKSAAFQRRVGGTLLNRVLRVAREWDEHPAAPDVKTTLVHGDFNSRNLLVTRRNGKWCVAAILDWEFAFAGPVYCDIGNFLRYEQAQFPRFEPSFSRGCRDGGVELSGDLLTAARMADLPALCELVARESTPDDVVIEICGLVAATVDHYDARREV